MRVIKFRYTYGIEGKPETYFAKAFTLAQIEGGDQFDEIMDSPLLRDYRILHRDQYTGLHDKNGVEIYENDTVTAETNTSPSINLTGTVIFDDCELLIEQDTDDFPLCSFHIIDRPSFEVIGNIYQTEEPAPELFPGTLEALGKLGVRK